MNYIEKLAQNLIFPLTFLQQISREQKQRRIENVRAAGVKFRQRLNQDPARREEYLRKKREYYHATKNNVLSQEEIIRKREYKAQQKRNWRLKRQEAASNQIPVKKVTKKVRRYYKNLKKKDKKIVKLKQNVYNLRKKVKFWQKKAKGEEQPPSEQITEEVEELLENTSENIDVIKKKLVMSLLMNNICKINFIIYNLKFT